MKTYEYILCFTTQKWFLITKYFNGIHSDQCDMVSDCSLSYIFQVVSNHKQLKNILHSFIVLLLITVYLLSLFIIWLVFGGLTFIVHYELCMYLSFECSLQYFHLLCRLIFNSNDIFLWRNFYFIWIHLLILRNECFLCYFAFVLNVLAHTCLLKTIFCTIYLVVDFFSHFKLSLRWDVCI